MASTYTTRLNLEKPGTGEQDGTWGGTLNTNYDSLDVVIGGYLSKSVAGASDVTLTSGEYANPVIECTGTLTGNINLIVPALERPYDIMNSTSGAFTLTVKTSGGTGVSVPQGGSARVVCDGTNVEQILASSSTGLADVVDDTTPQLGGSLDTNSKSINYSEGSAVSSGTTADIWATDGNTVHVTGTTTITGLGTAPRVGAIRNVVFDGALTLTHSSSLILPGGANITTAAGDCMIVYADTTSIARILAYTKADGTAVVVAAGGGGGGSVEVGMISDYAGSSAPSGWLLCYGQAISRTTYSDLYAIVGTTYGVGDGSTTFNLPDLRGRVVAGKDNMGGVSANRLTDASGGLNGDTLGDTGGSETHTLSGAESGTSAHQHATTGLTTDNESSHTHAAGTLAAASDGAHTHSGTFLIGGSDDPAAGTGGTLGATSSGSVGSGGAHTHTISGSSAAGSAHNHSLSGSVDASSAAAASSAHNNVQPTIILNKIIYTGV